MASQATRQRKGGGAPKSGEVLRKVSYVPTGEGSTVSNINVSAANNSINTQTQTKHAVIATPTVLKVAKVKRNKFGTSPWDENWLNLDCCGLFCAAITYMLHIYGVVCVCVILIPPWMSTVDEDGIRTISMMGHLNRVAFTLVAILAVFAHFQAMTTDPGAVPPDAIPLEEFIKSANPINNGDIENLDNNNNHISGESSKKTIKNSNGEQQGSSLMVEDPLMIAKPSPPPRKGRRLCRRCNSFKPKRAHHCSICKRCIIKMDHHCPWVNNCLVTMRFFDCMGRHGHIRTHHITCLDRPSQLLNILGLFVEAILFGLFTSCMMVDQASVVKTKMTHIDLLKGGGEGNVGSSALAGVIEVFGLNQKKVDNGGRFRSDWLSPFHRICFPTTLHDEIMGFCKPCSSTGSTGSSRLVTNGEKVETELSPMVRNVADIV